MEQNHQYLILIKFVSDGFYSSLFRLSDGEGGKEGKRKGGNGEVGRSDMGCG